MATISLCGVIKKGILFNMREFNEFLTFVKERDCATLLVGESALSHNGLVSGYNHYVINTDIQPMDKVSIGTITFEYWHLNDYLYTTEIQSRLFIPTPERAIIDCIIWQNKNYDEGFLIEALQTYQEQKHDVSDLYECADHYLVPHEVVDYWWQEALEESDMSMG